MYPKRDTMSLLTTTATAANANPPSNQYNNNSNEVAMPSNSLMSIGSNQMDTADNEELEKHLDDFVKQAAEEGKGPIEGKISFSPSHTFFWPPSFSRGLVAQDQHTQPIYNISFGHQFEHCSHHLWHMQWTLCLMC